MNRNEQKVLELLEENARISIEDIAGLLHIEKKQAADIICKLEKDKIVVKYTAVINETKVKRQVKKVRALVEVCINPQKKTGFNEIAKRVSRYPEVVDHYLVAGPYDFLLVVEGKDLEEISSFVFEKLATLENVRSTSTHFFMKKYKDHGMLIDDTEDFERLAISP
ncbi:Lrp/AsnC family transcriptional regulator [Candidatus Margulisiibacteriota bacterium]